MREGLEELKRQIKKLNVFFFFQNEDVYVIICFTKKYVGVRELKFVPYSSLSIRSVYFRFKDGLSFGRLVEKTKYALMS